MLRIWIPSCCTPPGCCLFKLPAVWAERLSPCSKHQRSHTSAKPQPAVPQTTTPNSLCPCRALELHHLAQISVTDCSNNLNFLLSLIVNVLFLYTTSGLLYLRICLNVCDQAGGENWSTRSRALCFAVDKCTNMLPCSVLLRSLRSVVIIGETLNRFTMLGLLVQVSWSAYTLLMLSSLAALLV